MRRLTRPRTVVLICLAAWLVLGPAALRALDLNLTHLALRGWNPLTSQGPTSTPISVPRCTDLPAVPASAGCDRATALVLLANGEPGGASAAAHLLAGLTPRRPLDLYFLGLAEQRAGNTPAAWRAWAQIGAEDHVLAHGTTLVLQGEYAAAIDEFSAILAVLPDNAGAYLGRGRAQAAQGRWADALADYRQAVARGGGPVAQTELGSALWYADHDLAGARTALEAGWSAAPNAWAGWTWARVLLDAGDKAGALAVAETARQYFPRDTNVIAVYSQALAAQAGGPAP